MKGQQLWFDISNFKAARKTALEMLPNAVATIAFLLTWGHCVSATRLTFSNSSVNNGARSSFIQRRLRSQERREIQQEILSILGLQHRPRPHVRTKHNAAPMFMLDLFNTISMDTDLPRYSFYKAVLPTHTSSMVNPQDSRLLDDADTVMSFVNLSKYNCCQANLSVVGCQFT